MKERETFGSRLGFILVSAGCAIGLGNVWKFPYMAGKYGGAAFILIYLIFLVLLGLPVLVCEFAVGRASRKSTARAGIWYPSHSCHAEAGCNDHPRPDTQQHGFPCLRQGGQRTFANHSRQHQRRRTDSKGCARPFHYRRRYGVSRLPVRRGAALTG